jgi:hypothetical protein
MKLIAVARLMQGLPIEHHGRAKLFLLGEPPHAVQQVNHFSGRQALPQPRAEHGATVHD